ncbi:MAG TPA: hypothetical protein P5555_03020 [Candidatus Paceibacterota bacterium]|nr:hypothetical protein [Verrucomicrobiota bacterium]HRZ44144.1 hypothetical protein [Candidatus Paceibacterota bacterium]HRZ91304.1 hypothetical protein [Candidatus Paceibacterota bacterium]
MRTPDGRDKRHGAWGCQNLGPMGLMLWGIVWLGASIQGAEPKPSPPSMVAVRGSSQQFVIHGVPLAQRANVAGPTAGKVLLDPAVLAVTCERIKQALLQELRAPDRWRGAIHVMIGAPAAAAPPMTIGSRFTGARWQYQVWLPSEVTAEGLVRTIVQALLLEMANRQAGPRPVEAPFWLVEGLAQHLLQVAGPELVLEPGSRVVRINLKAHPLQQVQAQVTTVDLLSFSQLSLPTSDTFAGEPWAAFRICSHLLVAELLRLPDGPQCLAGMLAILARHYNWQTAFLRAFAGHFQRLLDVEKWWSLVLANAGGRNRLHGWDSAAALAKLDEILRFPAQVRYAAGDLPVSALLTLQQVIQHWPFADQPDLIGLKRSQINALRVYAPPELVPLLDDYIAVLDFYVRERRQAGYEPNGRGPRSVRIAPLIRDTVAQLDALDARRQSPGSSTAPPPPFVPPKPPPGL